MTEEIVSEEEMNVLMETESSPEDTETVSTFDFGEQHNLLLARMRKLTTVRKRFVKALSRSLLDLYERDVSIELAFENACRFQDYVKKIKTPTNVNLIYIKPGDKPAVILMDAPLLYILVDQYFGGAGTLSGQLQSRALSATEWRTAQQLVELICRDLNKAWNGVADFTFSFAESYENPENLRAFAGNDVVLESVYRIGFDDALGEMHVVMPYGVLEGIRPALEGDPDPVPELNEPWQTALTEEVYAAPVRLSGEIPALNMTIEDLVKLKPGDVLPFTMPDLLDVHVEKVPTFKGSFGRVNNQLAIQITDSCVKPKQKGKLS